MKLSGKSFLGLAVTDKSVLAAEVAVSRDHGEVRRTAEFAFPEDVSIDKPAALGAALAQFLRQHKFSSSQAVVGLPAKWLMAREKEIPPSREDVAANMLRLQAERHFSPELKDLAFDFAGKPDPSKPQKVLLVAMQRPQLQRVTETIDAAGLSLVAVTSSTLALMAATGSQEDGVMLSVSPESVEMATRAGGSPQMLRYLPLGGVSPASKNGQSAMFMNLLGSELKRVVSVMPPDQGGRRDVLVWDGAGMDGGAAGLGERVGVPIRGGDGFAQLGVTNGSITKEEALRFGPAVALALAGGRRELLGVDFVHSRLAVKKEKRFGRKTVWALVLGIVATVVLGYLIYDMHSKQTDLDLISKNIKQIEPEANKAKVLSERVDFANGYFDLRRIGYLSCWKEITNCFRTDEPAWATSLTMKENQPKEGQPKDAQAKDAQQVTLTGTLTGRATTKEYALRVRDRLQNSKMISAVNVTQLQEVGGQSKDFSFSITFAFNPNAGAKK